MKQDRQFRIQNGFLWLPKKIGPKWKWLQFAMWEEERIRIQQFNWVNFIGGPRLDWSDWKPTRFIK